MLNETNLPKYLCVGFVNIDCYIMNYVLIRLILKKIPYEFYKRRNSNISHLHVVGCKYFILNNRKDNLENFDTKDDEISRIFHLQKGF